MSIPFRQDTIDEIKNFIINIQMVRDIIFPNFFR
ncbi:Uncharacterised protein [Klebsiella pneumoniae]|nr:Uncharacterised protein [Klebsiella pneumoniae]